MSSRSRGSEPEKLESMRPADSRPKQEKNKTHLLHQASTQIGQAPTCFHKGDFLQAERRFGFLSNFWPWFPLNHPQVRFHPWAIEPERAEQRPAEQVLHLRDELRQPLLAAPEADSRLPDLVGPTSRRDPQKTPQVLDLHPFLRGEAPLAMSPIDTQVESWSKEMDNHNPGLKGSSKNNPRTEGGRTL